MLISVTSEDRGAGEESARALAKAFVEDQVDERVEAERHEEQRVDEQVEHGRVPARAAALVHQRDDKRGEEQTIARHVDERLVEQHRVEHVRRPHHHQRFRALPFLFFFLLLFLFLFFFSLLALRRDRHGSDARPHLIAVEPVDEDEQAEHKRRAEHQELGARHGPIELRLDYLEAICAIL